MDPFPHRHRVVVGFGEQPGGGELADRGVLQGAQQRAGDAGVAQVAAVGPGLLAGRGESGRAGGDEVRHVVGAGGGERDHPGPLGEAPQADPVRGDVRAGAQQPDGGEGVVGELPVVAVGLRVAVGALVVDQRGDAAPGVRLGRGAQAARRARTGPGDHDQAGAGGGRGRGRGQDLAVQDGSAGAGELDRGADRGADRVGRTGRGGRGGGPSRSGEQDGQGCQQRGDQQCRRCAAQWSVASGVHRGPPPGRCSRRGQDCPGSGWSGDGGRTRVVVGKAPR